jgi:hypothetical protein
MPSPDIYSEPEENGSAPDLRPLLVVILGPTAVGKTEISLRLAERFEGEIISADSRLFYRGMDIGTAKPTPAGAGPESPHHLIDSRLTRTKPGAWRISSRQHAPLPLDVTPVGGSHFW